MVVDITPYLTLLNVTWLMGVCVVLLWALVLRRDVIAYNSMDVKRSTKIWSLVGDLIALNILTGFFFGLWCILYTVYSHPGAPPLPHPPYPPDGWWEFRGPCQ